jgi:hypothetical protein
LESEKSGRRWCTKTNEGEWVQMYSTWREPLTDKVTKYDCSDRKRYLYDVGDSVGGFCAFSSFPKTATSLLTRV